MNRKKLHKLERDIERFRRSSQKASALEKLASKLGRQMLKGAKARGKEPIWVSTEFEDLFPLSIPRHGGRDIAPGTKDSILDQLELDVISWDERLAEEEK